MKKLAGASGGLKSVGAMKGSSNGNVSPSAATECSTQQTSPAAPIEKPKPKMGGLKLGGAPGGTSIKDKIAKVN